MANILNISIVVIFTLFTIITLLIIIYTSSNRISLPLSPFAPQGIQGYSCLNSRCSSRFVCDPTLGICRLPDGSVCNTGSECLTNSYCSGICVDKPPSYVTGNANDPCPCVENMVCVPQESGTQNIDGNIAGEGQLLVCKKISGIPCNGNIECYNNLCSNGFCTSGLPVGSVCTVNSDCNTGLQCSLGYCQPNTITTGEVGAYCLNNAEPVCNLGLNCVNNVCVQAEGGLNQSCGANGVLCSHPLVCLTVPNLTSNFGSVSRDAHTPPNLTSNFGSVCQFPYPDPNLNVISGVNGPCVVNSNCTSGRCSGKGGVYQLIFNGVAGTSTDPFTLNGTYTIDYKLVWSGTDAFVFKIMESWTTPGEIYLQTTDGITDTNNNILVKGLIDFNSTSVRALIDADKSYIIFDIIDTSYNTKAVLYKFSNGTLTPFNVTMNSDLPGIQYYNSNPIKMTQISVSPIGDIVVADDNSVAYVLKHNTIEWTQFSVSNVNYPTFYNSGTGSNIPQEENISYIQNNLVKFNGSMSGLVIPIDRFGPQPYTANQYSVYSSLIYGIQGGYVLIAGSGILFMGIGGVMNPIPAFTNDSSLVLALEKGAYVYSPGSCHT